MADDDFASVKKSTVGQSKADQQAQKAKEAAEREENIKNTILSQAIFFRISLNSTYFKILDQSASARLSNLAAAKPEKAKMVENLIVQMARRGQIMGKMDDEALKHLLDRFSEQTRQTTTVKFDRRRAAIDSDTE